MVTAILLSAVLAFLLGIFWYSPKCFGTEWEDATGRKKKDFEEGRIAHMAVSIIGWLAASFVYAFLISHNMIQGDIQDYLFLSIALWGAFMMPPKAAAILHGNFNTKLLWIDGGYHLAGYLLFAVVFRICVQRNLAY